MCKNTDCDLRKIFKFPKDSKPTHCHKHKLKGMIKSIMKICKYPGCFKYPSYNFDTVLKESYCFDHKTPGMVNVKKKIAKMSKEKVKELREKNFIYKEEKNYCIGENCDEKYLFKEGYCMKCYYSLFPEEKIEKFSPYIKFDYLYVEIIEGRFFNEDESTKYIMKK